jgi:sugar O-acyltransferase (sialic acid O-acetyltransferase NeuD family)
MNDVKKTKKLVIVGAGVFGQIVCDYFTIDSEYEVIAFAVEKEFRNVDEVSGIPVIDFEELPQIYTTDEVECFVAITYTKLNQVRKRLYEKCKEMGYRCASYISSDAFVWHNVEIGENVFVFENNTIQYEVKIGNNTILWSGNHIGHHAVIGENCWLSSQVVISGFCKIGSGTFIGVNATLGGYVELGEDTIFGAGALTVKSLTDKGGVYIGSPAHKSSRSAYEQIIR